MRIVQSPFLEFRLKRQARHLVDGFGDVARLALVQSEIQERVHGAGVAQHADVSAVWNDGPPPEENARDDEMTQEHPEHPPVLAADAVRPAGLQPLATAERDALRLALQEADAPGARQPD